MAAIQDVVNLYVSTAAKWKNKAEKNAVMRGAVSGNAPDIDQGIQLARQVESLLREVRPDIFTDDTGFEHFAQPGVEPFGEVTISVFYYSGCEPIT